MPFDPTQSYGTISDTHPPLYIQGGVIYRSDTLAVVNDTTPYVYTRSGSTISALALIAQNGIPVLMAPSGFFANNGVYVVGQAPSNSATVSFSATSGAGVTMTFSAATLLGTSADNGRVVTILDTTYKYAVITAFSTTTVATATITGTLSGTGPFANASTWLSGTSFNIGNTVAFPALLPTNTAYNNLYLSFPVNAIATGQAAGAYYAQPLAGGPNPASVYTIYNNLIGTGAPSIPTSPIAFATTGPGTFTQTTGSNVTLATVPIPAGLLGPNGRFHVNLTALNNNSANTKTQTVTFGGTNINFTSSTTLISTSTDHHVINAGIPNAQQTSTNTGVGQSSLPPILTIDTTVTQNILFLGQLANANDWMGYNYFLVEAVPA